MEIGEADPVRRVGRSATGGIDLEVPLVSFDPSAAYSAAALGYSWPAPLRGSTAPVTRPGAGRLVVLDEAWAMLSNLGVARSLVASWKLARAHGVQSIAVTHRLSDLTATDDAGTEQGQIARGLLAHSESRTIHSLRPRSWSPLVPFST